MSFLFACISQTTKSFVDCRYIEYAVQCMRMTTYNDHRHAAETQVPSNTNTGRVVFAIETRLSFEIINLLTEVVSPNINMV
jgi:hypothetical protein